MILRQPDLTGISPVGRIMPVLAVSAIGEAGQEQDFRALQFTKGQEYFARIISRVDSNSFNVRVDSTVLKMNLGNAAQVGQNLLLKYIQDSPIPTFLLANNSADSSESMLNPSILNPSKVTLSPAASMLGHYLEQAEQAGATPRFEANSVITQTPGNPRLVAQDLKQAVASSGLFYESHLNELIQGQRSLSAILQEPQNQSALNQAQNQNSAALATLVSQQLTLMENQRMAWHGEVWPGQQMDWDVYEERHAPQDKQPPQSGSATEDRMMVSELTLHLPKLGKVSAKLQLENGHIRINIMAQEGSTLNTIRQQAPALVMAMEKTGQVIDAMTVAADK